MRIIVGIKRAFQIGFVLGILIDSFALAALQLPVPAIAQLFPAGETVIATASFASRLVTASAALAVLPVTGCPLLTV